MGQKTHPIGIRINNFIQWNNEYYCFNKTNNSKLFYNIFMLKYHILYLFFKKKLFIHSYSSKLINNNIYIKINIVSFYINYKYLTRNYFKYYINKLNLKKQKLIKLIFLYFDLKILVSVLKKILNLKKYSYKYLDIPYYKSSIYLKKFNKNKKNKLKNYKLLISTNTFNKILNSILKFKKLPNIVIFINNLTKNYCISNKFLKKKIKNNNFIILYYYFYLMKKVSLSSILISYFIKNILETHSLKKKQKFFLNNLKIFLSFYKNSKIKGIKIYIKGCLDGKDRSLLYKIQYGSISISTLTTKILYTFCPAFTVHGSFGIKVWVALI
jgi:Ribosomal protein S3, C-terminal domain